jgi:tRNA-specific 2-thiouridylase
VGQRRGLGVSGPVPLYVRSIDAEARRVVVGTREEAARGDFALRDVRWVSGRAPRDGAEYVVRIRHRHEGVRATLRGDDVRLASPTIGVSPGQAAVFYDEDEVVGGGWIV